MPWSPLPPMQNELHLMRQDLWDKVQPPGTAAGPQLSGGEDDALQQQDAPPHQPDQQPQRYDELDDDELLELQAEAMVRPGVCVCTYVLPRVCEHVRG